MKAFIAWFGASVFAALATGCDTTANDPIITDTANQSTSDSDKNPAHTSVPSKVDRGMIVDELERREGLSKAR